MIHLMSFERCYDIAEMDEYLNDGFVGEWQKGQDVTVIFIPSKYKRFFFERWYFSDGNDITNDATVAAKYPGDDAFRAWCRTSQREIFIFVDECENDDSIIWLIMHELTHIDIHHSNIMNFFLGIQRDQWLKNIKLSPDDYFSPTMMNRDELHEADPEEQVCNNVASTFLCGKTYDRAWWRKRKNEMCKKGGV